MLLPILIPNYILLTAIIFRKMIDNQVAISEDEKEKILREHEKNMAELESR